jgi:hypothetical protein
MKGCQNFAQKQLDQTCIWTAYISHGYEEANHHQTLISTVSKCNKGETDQSFLTLS